MDRALRCRHCRYVIGTYEPMIMLADAQIHKTSRAAEDAMGGPVGDCYHRACYMKMRDEEPDNE
jgi:hypothetical protein